MHLDHVQNLRFVISLAEWDEVDGAKECNELGSVCADIVEQSQNQQHRSQSKEEINLQRRPSL